MRDDARIPEWKLERFLAGELPASEMDRIRKAADSDETIRRRLEELRISNQEILKLYPPDTMSGRIRRRAAAAASQSHASGIRVVPFGSLPKLAAVAIALTAVFLIFFPRQIHRSIKDATDVDTTFKGGTPALVLYRKTPTGAELLNDGDIARPGDTVQIGYWGVGAHYGAILSLDGRGEVTLHFPERGTQAAPLESGHLARLGSAYELDDAPGWECFYLVTSEKPFEIDTVMKSARSVGRVENAPSRLPLSGSLNQSSFRLRKANK